MKIALRLKLIYFLLSAFWKDLKLKRKETIILAEMRSNKSLMAVQGNFLVYDAETIRNLPVDEKAKLGSRFPGLLQHLALNKRRLGLIAFKKKN